MISEQIEFGPCVFLPSKLPILIVSKEKYWNAKNSTFKGTYLLPFYA
jgi:hypothetical protein